MTITMVRRDALVDESFRPKAKMLSIDDNNVEVMTFIFVCGESN